MSDAKNETDETWDAEEGQSAVKKEDILSFKATGRILTIEAVSEEFQAMKDAYAKPLGAEQFSRIALGSGTHLLKMVTARADKDFCIIRAKAIDGKKNYDFLPSVNSPDIPIAKIVYRPLEIEGYPTKSLLEHIVSPNEISEQVCDAFAAVFGHDALEALVSGLTDDLPTLNVLPVGNFPIIYLPRHGGGDMQATPVSPAANFMGLKAAFGEFFQKQVKGEPRVPRGRFTKQSISSKPQNISGAIGGARQRMLAVMPDVMSNSDAEIMAFSKGGRFPTLRDGRIVDLVLLYASMLDRHDTYNNRDTRAALDRIAKQIASLAQNFVEEIIDELALLKEDEKNEMGEVPSLSAILLRRSWKDDGYDVAAKALTSPHFEVIADDISKKGR